jgi:nucleoside phosphorylase
MSDALPVLVIAATARELATKLPCPTLICGVGPVESAARTAAAIAMIQPMAVLHVGIAGARRGSGLKPGTIIIGSASLYTDLEVSRNLAPREIHPSADLIMAAGRAVPTAVKLPIGTTGRVGGSVGCEVEAMEGFAVLRAAGIAGIPAVEVRAISNEIEEEDRSRWHFDLAFGAITGVTPRLLEEIVACVS